jgi:pyruvate/2-oxoglutarate dehydrogenase complex dihydrolipoamide acyltransferase (E2) component
MSGDRVAVDTAAVWPARADAEEGVVVNWFVQEGRTVEEGETLCEIQVEKMSIDVPAPTSGELVEIVRSEDATFAKGDTLGWLAPG